MTPAAGRRGDGFAAIQRFHARHGLWTFPLTITDTGEKRPLVRWREFQSREPAAGQVAEWCRRFPDAGAAIPTGPGSGLLVVDADNTDAIDWLECRQMPKTVTLRTPRGRHYYFKYPVGVTVRNSAGAIAPGVDIRGAGGMATAAGTYSPVGGGFIYHFARGHALGEVKIAEAPDCLMEFFVKEDARRSTVQQPIRPQQFDGKVRAWARKIIDSELEALAATAVGARNHALATVAFRLGRLAGGGEADEAELIAALYQVADLWPNQSHSRDTISRAFPAGMQSPRCAPRLKIRRHNPWAYVRGLAGEYEGSEVADG
jgi:putative DNA primase/helicase